MNQPDNGSAHPRWRCPPASRIRRVRRPARRLPASWSPASAASSAHSGGSRCGLPRRSERDHENVRGDKCGGSERQQGDEAEDVVECERIASREISPFRLAAPCVERAAGSGIAPRVCLARATHHARTRSRSAPVPSSVFHTSSPRRVHTVHDRSGRLINTLSPFYLITPAHQAGSGSVHESPSQTSRSAPQPNRSGCSPTLAGRPTHRARRRCARPSSAGSD
jgi:hypothetical protein